MKRAGAIACAVLGLGLAGPAAAATGYGVSDDSGKYAEDGGVEFFARLKAMGLAQNRVTVLWHAETPTKIVEKAFLDRSIKNAREHGVRIVVAAYPARPTGITSSAAAPAQFAAWLKQLALEYREIDEFIVGNEPNQPRFWRPQFTPANKPASAAAYTRLLALSYDALKQVNPFVTVTGVAVSSRGNDNPRAANNISTSPVRFIRDMGVAYRKMRRFLPLMDKLAFHPYPNSSLDSLSTGLRWPNAGFANLSRIKQAIWDAFDGTAQPTFEDGLTFALGEIAWQVGIPATLRETYHGRENVKVTSEARQARIYRDAIYRAACDPHVTDLYFFGLIDEKDLDRFQAGMLRADGSLRPSYDAVKAAIARTKGGTRCIGKRVLWKHTTGVVGPKVFYGNLARGKSKKVNRFWGFKVTAQEQVNYTAALFRADQGRRLASTARLSITRSLARKGAGSALAAKPGRVSAGWKPRIVFPRRKLADGYYRFAIRMTAAMNPKRATILISKRFRVGTPAAAAAATSASLADR